MNRQHNRHLPGMIKRNAMLFLLWTLVLPCKPVLAAQPAGLPGDTLAMMRAFVLVCQSYQRLPLQLQLEVRRQTNFMTSPDDTTSQQASFYFGRGSSCIRFGELEQLGSDSLMVIVSHKLKRMLVYHNMGTVENLLARFAAGPLKDSSLAALGQRYEVATPRGGDDTGRLLLSSRQAILGTQLPKEEILALYNKTTQTPYKVVQLRRSLVAIEPEAWSDFAGQPGWDGKLVRSADSTCFLVKELRTEFCYRHIGHDPAGKMPVGISERIVAIAPGQWQAARGYEDFIISEP